MTHPRSLAAAAMVSSVLLLAGARSAAEDVQWVYPPPNSLLTESPAVILGYVSGPPRTSLDARVLSVEGDSEPRREALYVFRGKVFSGSVALAPGRNNVVVGDAVLPLLYRPGFEGDREGEFRRPRPHGGGLGSCNPCHGFLRGELVLKDPVPDLCLECHQVGTESLRAVIKQNQHTRTVTPECLRCHAPHVSFQADLVRTPENPCLECHADHGAPSRHEEAASPSCSACHDSHASAYAGLLKGEPLELCRECHPAVADPDRYPRSYHRPVEERRCFDCHRPHPAGPPSLLRAPVPDLCRECHPKREEGAHAGSLEECRVCHRGHLSSRRGLLREGISQVCVGCHGVFPEGVSRHPALGDGCIACHDPHQPRALAESERVCGRCHNLREEDFKWAHGQLTMTGVKQCTFCHDPHRADYPHLLRGVVHYPLQNGGCNACHDQDEGGDLTLRYRGSLNCTRCHGQITGTSAIVEEDKVHKPVYQVDCTACHNPHLGVRDYFLLEEPVVLCGWCHGLVLRGVENLHGVFREAGTCYTCHLPHISDFRPLLKRPERELCGKCHLEVLPEGIAEQRRLHGVVAQGRCTGCHNPHGADDPKLLTEGADALCRGCHPGVTRAEGGATLAYLHGPVGAGNCTACHVLGHRHEKPGDDFLRSEARGICALCHETGPEHVPGRYRSKMREVRNDCQACHLPHGADNPFLLRTGP